MSIFGYYNPAFTAGISAKIHVPDRICIADGLQNPTISPQKDELRNMMKVPKRIIVAETQNMSKGSTPVHTGSPFDGYYDPEFTAEISAKMHVPDRICVAEGLQNSMIPTQKDELRNMMNVPERIIVADKECVADMHNKDSASIERDYLKSVMNVSERIAISGDNKHIAVRDIVPELKFDKTFPTLPNYVLEAPPNVLTVDEYPSPLADIKKPVAKEAKKPSALLDTSGNGLDLNESSVSHAPEDEVLMLRKQLRHLSRRVLALEQESLQHQQREIILYAVGITYFLLKGLTWLHKHF